MSLVRRHTHTDTAGPGHGYLVEVSRSVREGSLWEDDPRYAAMKPQKGAAGILDFIIHRRRQKLYPGIACETHCIPVNTVVHLIHGYVRVTTR